jgi:Flp pilus assembly pilin Flp
MECGGRRHPAAFAGGTEMNMITRFVNDEQGADILEYALLFGLIALAAVGSLQIVGDGVKSLWKSIENAIVAADSKVS